MIPMDIVLEDERVFLRPLLYSDLEHLLHFALNEPDIWRYSLLSAATEEGMANYIKSAIADRDRKDSFPFIVFDKRAGAYAGCTRFYDMQPTFKTLQLGYTWYGKAFQGTGLNRHCKYLLLRHAFEAMGMERVEFRADNDNERSKAAMLAIGCKVDGVLRSNMPKPPGEPGRRDSIVLSILKDEWFNEVKERIAGML